MNNYKELKRENKQQYDVIQSLQMVNDSKERKIFNLKKKMEQMKA